MNVNQYNILTNDNSKCVCLCCRWIGCVAVLCMVVLVLAFNILGLLCGTCGYDKQATPTTRGCLSNTGGNLLMAYVPVSTALTLVVNRE